jgi:hypothetical protein
MRSSSHTARTVAARLARKASTLIDGGAIAALRAGRWFGARSCSSGAARHGTRWPARSNDALHGGAAAHRCSSGPGARLRRSCDVGRDCRDRCDRARGDAGFDVVRQRHLSRRVRRPAFHRSRSNTTAFINNDSKTVMDIINSTLASLKRPFGRARARRDEVRLRAAVRPVRFATASTPPHLPG